MMIYKIFASIFTAWLFSNIFLNLPINFSVIFLFILLIFFSSISKPEKTILFITLIRSTVDFLRDITRLGGTPLNITSLFSIFIIIYGLFYFSFHAKTFRPVKAFFLLLLFILTCCLSIIYSPNKFGSLEDTLRFCSYFLLAMLIIDIFKTRESIQRFINCFLFSFIPPLAVGFYQLLTNSGFIYAGYNRLYGTLQHPSSYGKFLIVFFVFLLTFILRKDIQSKSKKMHWFLFIIVTLQIGLTFTRAAWIECLIASLFLGIMMRRKRWVLSVCVLGIIFLSFPMVQQRFLQEVQTGQKLSSFAAKSSLLTGSLKSRFEYNEFLIKDMFLKSPLIGQGIGSFYYFYAPKNFGLQIESHGDLSKLLGEVGIFGSFFYYGGLISIFIFLLRHLKRVKDPSMNQIITSAVCILGLRLFISNFDAELRLVLVQWYYWSLYGIAFASVRYSLSQEKV